MNLKRGFQVFLTIKAVNINICLVKTMAYKPFQVNEGNEKKSHSPVRSPDNTLNLKEIQCKGERGNDFSRTHVRKYFFLLLLISFILYTTPILFFLFSRTRVFFYSPRSLLIKNNIKTKTYQVNEQVNDHFTRSPHSPVIHLCIF